MQKNTFLDSNTRLVRIIEEMKNARLRVTKPRVAILRVFLEKHGPFTAEEIHIKATKEVCDLATIYRSLNSLEKATIIRRCEFGDGTARYELSERETQHHHHHVICKICKKIEILDDCKLHDIDFFPKKHGFLDVIHSLEFFGICPVCQKDLK